MRSLKSSCLVISSAGVGNEEVLSARKKEKVKKKRVSNNNKLVIKGKRIACGCGDSGEFL